MQILLIENDPILSSVLRAQLASLHFKVVHALDHRTGFELTLEKSFDLLMLGVQNPKFGQFNLIKEWRDQGLETPVLILSTGESIEDIVHGLEVGGDDYLTRPFAFAELLARMKALVRRGTRRRGSWSSDHSIRNLKQNLELSI